MVLMSALDLSLPLKNPVIIFSLVLFIILFAPILFNKLKIPHIIGLILAGVIIGPYGFNLLLRDSSIVLFGTVGLLYIMFIAGLEIDIEEFKKSRFKSLIFGLLTFSVPMVLGTLAAYYILHFSLLSAILLAGLLSSHTLLAYPIVSKYGISRILSVTLTIGGTIITDILALLVLAAVVGITKGEIGPAFWIKLAISCVIFGCIIFFLFPLIARWFFKKFEDSISQYIFVLAMVFLGSFLAEIAGLEAIVGAFLSGLALNRFIPRLSPLMNRIDFVGNAFFIPFFLISVGMLVDIRNLFQGLRALEVAGMMILLAVVSKYIAAWFTQKSFRLDSQERQLIFGLSNSRVGATLAVVLVGYNTILAETISGEPIRLLNEDVLNGAVLMILVTCTISSFVVEKAARQIALKEEEKADTPIDKDQKILISLAYPDTVPELVSFGLLLKPQKSDTPVYALHVIDDKKTTDNSPSKGKKLMDKAQMHAAATENTLLPIIRFDGNASNGIIYTIKEYDITDVLIGLHHQEKKDAFLGFKAENILNKVFETVYIYKPFQPFNTLKRIVVAVPPKAELEIGFSYWVNSLFIISKEAGMPIIYHANSNTISTIENLHQASANPVKAEFKEFLNWEDFLILRSELKANDFFIVVSSRKNQVSYQDSLEKIPYFLSNYFKQNSFILLYPKQLEKEDEPDYINPDLKLMEAIKVMGRAGKFKNIFRGKR